MNFNCVSSKNTKRSASSSGRSGTHSDSKSDLTSEVESLRHTVELLKTSIENRDAAIGKLAREKEKVFVELKGAQRTVRDVRQQLCDERAIHTKEKGYLVEEIQRISTKEKEVKPKQFYSNQTNLLQKEQIKSLQDQLVKKDEVICKICEKYMKLKNNKSSLHRILQRMKTEVLETHQKTICLLEENKQVMEKLFKKMCKSSSVPVGRKEYLKLLNQNIKLQNENAQLKLCLSTNISEKEDREKMIPEDRDVDPVVTPVERLDKAQQTHSFSEENPDCNPKSHRCHIKWRRQKNKKLSDRSSRALLGSLYRKHVSHSIQLQSSFQKSISMPNLR